MTLKKINILEYAFGEGVNKKEYSLYAFINVDNCERPLRLNSTVGPTMERSWYIDRTLLHCFLK